MTQTDVAAWFSESAPAARTALPDALLFTTLALLVAAPLAGICATRIGAPDDAPQGVRAAVRTAGLLVVAAGIFAGAWSLTAVGLGGWPGAALPAVLRPAPVLALAGIMLGLFGAVCGARLRDPLDAAALSLAATATASFALLAAGSGVAQAPRWVIEWALTGSPLVAVASVAHIDLLRTDTLYQISPLAHLQVDLPTWPVACGVYFAAATSWFAVLAWHYGRARTAGQMGPPMERTLA